MGKAISTKRTIADWTTKENLTKITEIASKGLFMKDIAEAMDIGISSLYDWMNKSTEILEAVKKGRQRSVNIVENALFRNAVGYYYKEQQPFKVKVESFDSKGRKVVKEKIDVVEVEKYKQPETTAQIYILNNLDSKNWKNRTFVQAGEDEEAPTTNFSEVFKKAVLNEKTVSE